MHPWIGAGPEDRRRILDELGLRLARTLCSPPFRPECVSTDWTCRTVRTRRPCPADPRPVAGTNIALAARPELPRRRRLPAHPAGVGRLGAVAGRVLHLVHPVPARDLPGHPAGDLRVPDPDLPAHRLRRRQRLPVRRRDAHGRGGALRPPRAARQAPPGACIAETVHPMYRTVLETYTDAVGIDVTVVPPGSDGRIDPERLRAPPATTPAASSSSRRASSERSRTCRRSRTRLTTPARSPSRW